MPAMTPRAEPPWTLNEPVATVTLPLEAAVQIAQRAAEPVEIEWPRVRVTQDQPPPAPPVVRLAAPPQGPWRMPLPPVLRHLLAGPLPPRRDRA